MEKYKVFDSVVYGKEEEGIISNYMINTFVENNVFYSFFHEDESESKVSDSSKLIGHFQFEDEAKYVEYKNNINKIFKELSEKESFKKEDVVNAHYDLNDKLNLNGWLELSKKSKVEYKAGSGFKGSSSRIAFSQIKPVVLLETMSNLGIIDVQDVSSNITGEEFWKFDITGSNEYKFKTSVKTKKFVFGNQGNPKSDIFVDVYNDSKGYGRGAIGVITYLGSHGLFDEEFKGLDKKEKFEYVADYLKKEIMPHISEDDLVTKNNIEKNVAFIEPKNNSPMPFDKKGGEQKIEDFLSYRGISPETIKHLMDSKKVHSGFFLQNDMQKGHKVHFNQVFFGLEDSTDKVKGSERFTIWQTPEGYGAKKLNTHRVTGNAFKLRGENPKMTVFTEAIVDAISEQELIKKAGLPTENYNVFSVQGCNHLNNWFQHNLGFGFELKEENQAEYGKIFAVTKREDNGILSEKELEAYNKEFKSNSLVFMEDKETTSVDKESIEAFGRMIGKEVEFIQKEYRAAYVEYKNFDKNTLFFDSTNIENFLKDNNLSFDEDGKSIKRNKLSIIREKLTPSKVEEIKDNIINNLGCLDMAMAFDNDDAGLKYVVLCDYLQEELGVNMFNSIPSSSIKENPDVNDVLKKYNLLMSENKVDDANDVLQEHIKKIEPDFEVKKKIKSNMQNKFR